MRIGLQRQLGEILIPTKTSVYGFSRPAINDGCLLSHAVSIHRLKECDYKCLVKQDILDIIELWIVPALI